LKMKRTTLVMLFLLGVLLLSACSGNSRTIVNTWPGLAADDARAYLSAGSHVYAVDVKNGSEVWRYPAEADNAMQFYAVPVLTADGQLLVGSEGTGHAFFSLNPETGKENWTEPFTGAKGKWVAAPLVFNERIYAPNTDGFLYTLGMDGKQAADPIELGGALWSAPVTDGQFIYVASLDHHLHIIDPANGTTGDPVDLGGAIPGSPAATEGGVYVGSFSSTVEIVGANGQHESAATTTNWIWGSPTLDGDTLFYADLSGNVYSLDIPSGSQNWGAIQPDGPIVANPLVMGDQIYFATEEGSFFALDRDGKTLWQKTTGGKIYTTPVVSGTLVLVAPYQGDFAIAAYDGEGKQAWTFTPAK